MKHCEYNDDTEREVRKLFEDIKEVSEKMSHVAKIPFDDLLSIIQNPMKIAPDEFNQWFKSIKICKRKYDRLIFLAFIIKYTLSIWPHILNKNKVAACG
jgi:hypothetical protein